ncbi:MAG: DciA family protein [Methylomonas sp.]
MRHTRKSAFKSALDFDARQLAICMEIIAEQKTLLSIVKTALPAEIAGHVQHCVRSGNRLLIYTETASWGSQIRFFNVNILNNIAESGQKNITSLQVRLSPQLIQKKPPRQPRLPSAENIGLLRDQLSGHETDDVLTQALSKLSRTLEKRLKAKA